jgi:hypothetical protein
MSDNSCRINRSLAKFLASVTPAQASQLLVLETGPLLQAHPVLQKTAR